MGDNVCTELTDVTARTDRRVSGDPRRKPNIRRRESGSMVKRPRYNIMGTSNLPVWQQLLLLMLASLPGFALFAGITFGVNSQRWDSQEKFNERIERKVDAIFQQSIETQSEVFVLKKNRSEQNRLNRYSPE